MEELDLENRKKKSILDRIRNFDMNKSWMWLLYLDLVLPLCLFLLAYVLNALGTGFFLSKLFHTYNLFVINPIPNFTSFTGILGLILHIGVIAYALWKKDWRDVLACVGITALVFLYFFFEVNYIFTYMLKFV